MDLISHDSETWYHMLVVEKSISLSDFMASKTPSISSDHPQEREDAIKEVVDVVKTFPKDFLHSDEASLLMEFFLHSLDSSALTGCAAINGLHAVIIKINGLPGYFEDSLFRVLFREGNLQSWARKERIFLYEIFEWFLRERISYLKATGAEFLSVYLKNISGERDPRCLVYVFRTFTEVTRNFSFGPFTEDMFETVACYYPIVFKSQPSDVISREYLAATCASCLVGHVSFAPFCFMFIDEKLNDEECTEQESNDIFDLLTMACEKFPPQNDLSHLEPLFDTIRQKALNPKNKGEVPEYLRRSFEALIQFSHASSSGNPEKLNSIVSSFIENSEPFVLQAEMGLSRNALIMLQCAFRFLPHKSSQIILKQTIAWILNLINGDSVSSTNKIEIVKEGLEYLRAWINLATESRHSSIESLIVFEQSLFASCTLAREFHPQEALITIYECAKIYIDSGCASDGLIYQCRSWIVSSITAVHDPIEFDSCLQLLSTFSFGHLKLIEEILDESNLENIDEQKIFHVLCAVVSSQNAWNLFRDRIVNKLVKNIDTQSVLSSYEKMMERNKGNISLLLEQFTAFEKSVFKIRGSNCRHISHNLQSIALLLPPRDHENFMESVTYMYTSIETRDLVEFDRKYRLAYLQNKKSSDLLTVINLQLPRQALRQLCFACFNRDPSVHLPIQDNVAFLKSSLLNGSKNSKSMLEQFIMENSLNSCESNLVEDIEFLFDFESDFSNPERCRYETGSTLWRQRIFCLIVPVCKTWFDKSKENAFLLEMLPHLINLAMSLDSKQLKNEFEMLLPILIESLSETKVHTGVARSIPLFLKISGQLALKDLSKVLCHICSNLTDVNCSMESLEEGLSSLRILAHNQSPQSLIPNLAVVVKSVDRILGHKKRLIRKTAADVKNIWEMLISE